ncbi:MAG TPA: hypothetical protein VMF11_10745 [Candidatus Baltobacteraceae bacterium]|nr:hypothetical protein [Candidatus Baltobacteraceae bacterium]
MTRAPADVRIRLDAAIRRRQQQERFDRQAGYAVSLIGLVVAACGFFVLISLPVLGALFSALLSGGLAYQLLRVERVRPGARIANLRRRDIRRIIPLWYLSLPVIGWCCSAYFAWASGEWIAMAISLGASALAIALCFVAASAPALLGSDDPSADEAVDAALRTLRVGSLLFIAATGTFILASLIFMPDYVATAVRLVCAGSYFAMALGMQRLKKSIPASIAAMMA